ncbi:hypothetical protein Pelo_5304 [Pelomyxa schiedti]|nr:hypothetical protein Pelo_5304 [Pelomyxa schiedti]
MGNSGSGLESDQDAAVFVFSDLHLGAFPFKNKKGWYPTPTERINVWRSYILAWSVSARSRANRLVIMNGDIFDVWAQPGDILFTSIHDIETFTAAEAIKDPNIAPQTKKFLQNAGGHFDLPGACALFKETIRQLAGEGVKFVYIMGNHDMTLKPIEIQQFFEGVEVTVKENFIFSSTRFEHGHSYDFFNHVVTEEKELTVFGMLPFGYLFSKVDSCFLEEPINSKGNPPVHSYIQAFHQEMHDHIHHGKTLPEIIGTITLAMLNHFGRGKDPSTILIKMPHPSGPRTMTAKEIYDIYLEATVRMHNHEILKADVEPGSVRTASSEPPIDKVKHHVLVSLGQAFPTFASMEASEVCDPYAVKLLNADPSLQSVVLGHTHHAWISKIDGKLYFNSGTGTYGSASTALSLSYKPGKQVSGKILGNA